MIKTFEQFVSTVYGSTINEAFQSSKLRELVKQHGELKYSSEKRFFYDLTDNDIIDVVANYGEYWENIKNGKYNDVKVDCLQFKDGTCVVYNDKDFNKIYNDRHKGNNNIKYNYKNWKQNNKLDKLFISYFKRKYKQNIDKLINIIYTAETDYKNPLYEYIGDSIKFKLENSLESGNMEVLIEEKVEDFFGLDSFSYNNQICEIYSIAINYYLSYDSGEDYGRYAPATAGYKFESFDIDTDFGIITSDDLGITEKTHKDLFNNYTKIDLSDYLDYSTDDDYCPPRPH